MQWYGGFVPKPGATSAPVPTDPILRIYGLQAFWTTGDPCLVVQDERRTIVVVGDSSASRSEVRALLRHPALPGDISTRWAGSYTVVSLAPDAVIIATDLVGARPIYITRLDQGIVWGSSSRALASLVGIQPDEQFAALSLVAGGVSPAFFGRSAFKDVSLLPPGSIVWLPREGRVETHQGWQPPQLDWVEAVDAFQQALSDSVRLRVTQQTHVSADLSGGLDSTTVGLVADLNSPGNVLMTTFCPKGVHSGGDLDYVQDVLDENSFLRHRWIELDDGHTPYSSLFESPATDEPAPSLLSFARLRAQLWVLRAWGSDVHLTGDGGDTVLQAPPIYMADLWRNHQFWRFWKDASGWARVHRSDPKQVAARARRHAKRDHLQTMLGLSNTAVSSVENGWYASQGIPDTACGSLAKEAIYKSAYYPLPTDEFGNQASMTALYTVGRTAAADAQLAQAFNINLANPFLDGQVVAAAMSVSASSRTTPEQFKPLLTHGFMGLLPRSVLNRTTKGSYEQDQYRGLRRNQNVIGSALYYGELRRERLISAALNGQINQLLEGQVVEPSVEMDAALAYEAWLYAIKEDAPIGWTVQEVQTA